jgi:hypothetical protein
LFCTIAQPAQVLDLLHRSGNVQDPNGAQAFICACIEPVRAALPGIQFTISVPFERLSAPKPSIEQRRRWRPVAADCAAFEMRW